VQPGDDYYTFTDLPTTILDEGVGDSDLNEYLRRLPETDDFVGFARTAQLPVSVIRSAFTELIALRALATPSTGAVGIITGEGENGTEVSWYEGPELSKGTKLYAAPPSSPSERDAALEEAAAAARNVLQARATYHRSASERAAKHYDRDDYIRSLEATATEVEKAIRALQASRSDTVGPEAGE
jgi:hypothetical protein